MRLAIMQPYFFPYPGHFSLIANVDAWIVFDITQYTPRSWITRNQVLHPRGGANWVNVPLEVSSTSLKIHECRVRDVAATERSTLGKLSHYRREAPHARQVEDLVEAAFAHGGRSDSLVDLDVGALDAVCAYLRLPFPRKICSRMNLDLPQHLGPGEWALEIADRVGADTYVNPIGGRALFDAKAFAERGIALEFLQADPFVYRPGSFDFVPDLSILDALMWNSPEAVRAALTSHAAVVAAEPD